MFPATELAGREREGETQTEPVNVLVRRSEHYDIEVCRSRFQKLIEIWPVHNKIEFAS